MILSRSRSGAILLAIAAIMTCLALLSTTSSAAQTRTEARAGGAVAVAGGNDCLNSNDNNTGTGTNTSPDNTSPDNTSDQQNADGSNSDQQTLQNDVEGDQQTQSNDQQVQSQDESNDQQAQSSDQQMQQNVNGDQQTQNGDGEDNGDSQTLQDGEGNTTAQDAQDNAGDTTSPDAQDNANNECVLANTVPDQSLPPTGAPVKSRTAETTAEKKTDPGKKPEAGSEEQKKSDSSKKQESNNEQHKKSGSGKKLEIQERGKKIDIQDRSGTMSHQEKPKSSPETASGSSKAAPGSSETASSSSEAAPKKDLAPVLATKWTRPSREEVASTDKPRRFAPNPGSEMTMSVRALGLYNAPVADSNRLEDLDNGLVREPKTSLPWDKGAQRNVYVAGHYLGYPDTPSRLVFYNLHKLEKNDEIILKDNLGQSYKYRVSEKFAAGPEDSWAMGQVKGRDMLTLQTCIPPDFGKRLIVRADRV